MKFSDGNTADCRRNGAPTTVGERNGKGRRGKRNERMKGDVEGTEEDRRGKDHLKWLQLRKLQRNAKREKGQKIAAELIRG